MDLVINQEDLVAVAQELADRIDELYGLYLDATSGFKANVEKIVKGQEEVAHVIPDPTERDRLPLFIGRGDPNDLNNVLLHQTTQGRFKERNSPGGDNYRLLSQYFVVLVFHLWEHEYRPRFASLLGLKEVDDLKLPLFGDLRLLRHEILKHRGILTRDTVKRLQVLSGLDAEQVVSLSEDDLEHLARAIKAALDQMVHSAIGVDPKLRTVWHVQ